MHKNILLILAIFWSANSVWAKTAHDYFLEAGLQYAQAKYPTASITAKEGLSKFPHDAKLERLLKRIEEMQKKQKDQCNKENPPNQNQDNQDSQNSQDQKDSKDQGKSSSSQSDDKPQGNSSANSSSSSSGANPPEPQEPSSDKLSPQQAEQLLKDFQENDQDRKKARKAYGRAVPDKDW